MSSQHLRVAAVQAEPVFLDREEMGQQSLALIEAAAVNGAELIVFPEAFVPGYPAWLWAGRADVEPDAYVRLYANAVEVFDATTACLAEAATRAGVGLAIGVTEPDAACSRATRYNTLLLFDLTGTFSASAQADAHVQKRTVWGQGDASSLFAAEVYGVRVGGLICWENLMPLARQAMYGHGEQLLESKGRRRPTSLPPCGTAARRAGGSAARWRWYACRSAPC